MSLKINNSILRIISMTILYCLSNYVPSFLFVCDLIKSKRYDLFVKSYENVTKVNVICMRCTQLRDDQMEL